MTTQTYTLSQTPTQILDGTKAAYIQEIRRQNTRFCTSDTTPNTSTTSYCQILNNDLSVSSGFKDAASEVCSKTLIAVSISAMLQVLCICLITGNFIYQRF